MILRDIYMYKTTRTPTIYIVRGSQVEIGLKLMDYELQNSASVTAYARRGEGATYQAECTVREGIVVLVPPDGFFLPGDNALQIEIDGTLIPCSVPVACEERISDGGAVEPERLKGLAERAETAAAEAERVAASIPLDYSALSALVGDLIETGAPKHDAFEWAFKYVSPTDGRLQNPAPAQSRIANTNLVTLPKGSRISVSDGNMQRVAMYNAETGEYIKSYPENTTFSADPYYLDAEYAIRVSIKKRDNGQYDATTDADGIVNAVPYSYAKVNILDLLDRVAKLEAAFGIRAMEAMEDE